MKRRIEWTQGCLNCHYLIKCLAMWGFYMIFVFKRYSKIGMNKHLLGRWVALIALVAPLALTAQTDPLFTHFTFNKLFYNPAYAGASGQFCLNAINHQQWLGYDDESPFLKPQDNQFGIENKLDAARKNIAPVTRGLGFSAPIMVKGNNMGGAFFSLVTDQIGYETATYMKGGGSFAYTMSDGSNIRLGVDITNLTKTLDAAKLRYHDPNDPMIPTGSPSDQHTTFGAGLYYSNPNIEDGAYLGVSSTHLNPQTFSYGPSGTINVTTNRHLYIVGGYKKNNFMGNPSLTLDPAFLIKTAMSVGGLVKPQLDVQGLVTWNGLFAGGANIRVYGLGAESVSLILGYYPPLLGNGPMSDQKLRVGYSYDLTVNNILRNSGGSHELQVNYCFMFTVPERPVRVFRHPRYMERSPEWD